ncbi:zf-TFIIB domain-containing protein [Rhizobiales bacterium TNE-4]|nr:zf-TFIIB domain-containing protein [Rhizobiales bacterium TNE-4]MBV1827484.1 zf-TFIIB domain-containing protein [Rhizobiales bacterium TNE-4]
MEDRMNTATGMLCPTCRVGLVMSERQGVEIDYCPQCRGVWLDRGELDKIIERNAREEAPRAAPPPQQPVHHAPPPPSYGYDHGYGHKPYKKRKSFLEELFD